MKEAIRKRARELGFEECRFTSARKPDSGPAFEVWLKEGMHGTMGYLERNAAKRLDPGLVLAEAQSIITLASSYVAPSPALRASSENSAGPTGVVARYARFADYHEVLQPALVELTAAIAATSSRPIQSLWYVDTGPLLERDLAQRAGLGFVGKHTGLISRSLGNWFFISEILTTARFEPDPPEANHCGTCARCLDACPTGAILRPFQLDARRCISYLTIELKGSIPLEFRTALGNRIYGCDDCLATCPWNRFAKAGRLMAAHSRDDLSAPSLLALLSLDEANFKRQFAGTPILRTKRRGLLRNVCVALGNIGDASALPHLSRAAEDPEPLIAEHARWAIDQIQSRMQAGATETPS